MKKFSLILGMLILSLFITPSFKVNAETVVNNEEELRAAISQGGDIVINSDIEVKDTITINKDTNITYEHYDNEIFLNDDKTLLEVNNANVNIDVNLTTGNKNEGNYEIKGGKALVINSGNVNISSREIRAGNAIVANGGNVNIYDPYIFANDIAIIANDGSNVKVMPREGQKSALIGYKNAMYLNGGTIELDGPVVVSSYDDIKSIYINKGYNTKTNEEALKFNTNFVFGYLKDQKPNFSIYVNPEIKDLKINDAKNWLEVKNNKLTLNFCSNSYMLYSSNTIEERNEICGNMHAVYDGPIYSNELSKCMNVYISGNLNTIDDGTCNVKDTENTQVVEVPSTSAQMSIIIASIGIIFISLAVIVTKHITKKNQ